jgi:aspartyl/asparaginyl beta-hydroxylase (cupin superfamily)
MRIGAERRRWRAGRVTLFDDSYEHEVWNNASSPRVVLLIDVWHPDLSERERELVREQLQHASGTWWSRGSPFEKQHYELDLAAGV